MEKQPKKRGTSHVRRIQPAVEIPAVDLLQIREHYEKGLVRKALDLSLTFGPLESWVGASAQIMGGRIAINLGAPRIGHWLHYRAFHSAPTEVASQAYFMSAVLGRFGPLTALRWFERLAAPTGADHEGDSHQFLLTLRARAHAHLRDFEQAEKHLAQAEELDPKSPWIWIERSSLLEAEDRYDEALAAAQQSIALRAWYRPGIQSTAHLLQVMDRDDEALKLLEEASRRMESVPLLMQLAMLQIDLQRHAEAQATLDAIVTLSPILDPGHHEWLQGHRVRAAYFQGDFTTAAAHAREMEGKYFEEFVARLSQPNPVRRAVRWPVDFVRQHHLTCVPATLTAISRFWNRPAEHLAVAEKICHDGTPAHSERHWAETNGWCTREFTVTWDSAVALLERGIPFTLTTTEATSGHLQAVIGFDDLRRTLWIRDPFQYYAGEGNADALLDRYRAHGPRGMAMVPAERAELFDGIDLPDSALYDRLHSLQRALFEHRRPEAEAELSRMQTEAPGHRLTLTARRSLAAYDENGVAALAAVEELLRLYPQDANLRLARLAWLRDLGRRDDRLAMLAEICAEPGIDPVFWREYADELRADARQIEEATRWARRALRQRPVDAHNLAGVADLLWTRREFSAAFELYRFAACLDDRREQPARAYFAAARHLKQTPPALALLRRRFDRFGRKSAWTATTLAEALIQLDEVPQALAVLEEAMRLRPEDGELRLYAARSFAHWGRLEPAEKLLTTAGGQAQPIAVLRTAAEIAGYRTDTASSLSLWQQVLELDPLAMDAHRAVARALAETKGRAAAIEHLRSACARFPLHYALHQLVVGWLNNEGVAAAEPVLRRMIDVHPADAWARRELAILLGEQARAAEGLTWAESALQLDPTHPGSHSIRGELRLRLDDREGARADFQQALRLSIDHDAFTGLMRTCVSLDDRRTALRFIEQELIRQTVFGDGLLAFREVARGIQPPDELLASLRAAREARPDLWHAWSAVVLQLIDLQRFDEADTLAREAADRFPLLPRLWLDRALVARAKLDAEAEVQYLRQALEINPSYSLASQRLSEAIERTGDFLAARKVMEDASRRLPLDAVNHGYVAALLWKTGDRTAACLRLEQALRINPAYDWAWQSLRAWTKELEQPERPVQLARDLAASRGGEPQSWLVLARMLIGTPHRAELEAALDRAIALQPRQVAAYEVKAQAMVAMERYEEALAACHPVAWPDSPPLDLRARAAWVEAERGDLRRAIELMTGVLQEDPARPGNWQSLADWHSNAGHHDEAIAAAQKLAEFNPLNPAPFGYIADLKLKKGDRAGAKQDLERAVTLDPTYGFAGMTLFDLELEDGNFAAARRHLSTLQQHVRGPFVDARDGQLAGREGRIDHALAILERLCLVPDLGLWPVQSIVTLLDESGHRRDVTRVLKAALAKTEVTPVVGELWVRRETGRSRWFGLRRLGQLTTRGEIGRRALIAWLECFGESAQEHRQRFGRSPFFRTLAFRWLVRKHRTLLTTNDECWGAAGYAHACLQRPRATVRWLSSWREHPTARPWMLANLVTALRNLRRDAEADEVCRAVLKMPVRDHTTADAALWLAMEQLLSDDDAALAEATRCLDQHQAADFTPRLQEIFALGRAVVAVRQSPEPERKRIAREQQKLLGEVFPGISLTRRSQCSRRMFRRCLQRMARDARSSRLGWWCRWKLHWPVE